MLDSHSAKMNEAHKFNSVSGKFDDTDFAKLHLRYKSLFYHYDSFTPDLKFLVGAATFYFIEQEDEIPDMDPFFGLDDDAEVLEEVLRVIKEST
ncbi:MAG: YkvA family protein [Proteobacteria bacterium]|nr:YkvA family protein [Pseudomonadota bacterium]